MMMPSQDVLSTITDEYLLDYVLSFVGDGHYLTVALVNQPRLRKRYVALFPKKQTWFRVGLSNQELLHIFMQEDDHEVSYYAAKYGQTKVLEYLKANDELVYTTKATALAAAGGHLKTLQWLRSKKCPWDEKTCFEAVKHGHTHILQWARDPNPEMGSQQSLWKERSIFNLYVLLMRFIYAAVEWFLGPKQDTAQNCPWDAVACGFQAATDGHLDVLKWMFRNCWDDVAPPSPHDNLNRGRHMIQENLFDAAAKSGHLDILRWSRTNDLQWNQSTICRAAATSGNLEMLQWLRREQECPWDVTTSVAAARHGHLDVLQWAHANGCPCDDEKVCNVAAEGGYLDILQWLRANDCPWSAQTCSSAAGNGHLDVLIWARTNGCPWDRSTISRAKGGGHWNVVEWAVENGCPVPVPTEPAAVEEILREWRRRRM